MVQDLNTALTASEAPIPSAPAPSTTPPTATAPGASASALREAYGMPVPPPAGSPPPASAPTAAELNINVDVDDMPPLGEEVVVKGLRQNHGLNGRKGKVVGYRGDGAVLVDFIDIDIRSAPIRPKNLKWGADAAREPSTEHLPENVVMTHHQGTTLLKVRPVKDDRLDGDDMDSSCCPVRICSFEPFMVWAQQIIQFKFAAISWAMCIAFTILGMLCPFILPWVAISIRAMAHGDVYYLLMCSPPTQGAVLAHPDATLKHRSFGRYMKSSHTWKCWMFLILPQMFLALLATVVSSLALALAFVPYGSGVAENIMKGMLAMQRGFAVTLLTRKICSWDVYVADLGRAPDVEDVPALGDDVEPEVEYVTAADIVGGEEVSTEEPKFANPPTTQQTETQALLARESNVHLIARARSFEEEGALHKFAAAFLRVYGYPAPIQDITICPPNEPGRGPRHYIRIASSLADSDRLKLIKAYKQHYATMYVHVADKDEQERQMGTDYSGLYM